MTEKDELSRSSPIGCASASDSSDPSSTKCTKRPPSIASMSLSRPSLSKPKAFPFRSGTRLPFDLPIRNPPSHPSDDLDVGGERISMGRPRRIDSFASISIREDSENASGRRAERSGNEAIGSRASLERTRYGEEKGKRFLWKVFFFVCFVSSREERVRRTSSRGLDVIPSVSYGWFEEEGPAGDPFHHEER